jgi:hypothetical protein
MLKFMRRHAPNAAHTAMSFRSYLCIIYFNSWHTCIRRSWHKKRPTNCTVPFASAASAFIDEFTQVANSIDLVLWNHSMPSFQLPDRSILRSSHQRIISDDTYRTMGTTAQSVEQWNHLHPDRVELFRLDRLCDYPGSKVYRPFEPHHGHIIAEFVINYKLTPFNKKILSPTTNDLIIA